MEWGVTGEVEVEVEVGWYRVGFLDGRGGEKSGGEGGGWEKRGGFCAFSFFFFFGRFKKIYLFCHVAHIWQPRGTNVATMSALNGSMDEKCNGCIILK